MTDGSALSGLQRPMATLVDNGMESRRPMSYTCQFATISESVQPGAFHLNERDCWHVGMAVYYIMVTGLHARRHSSINASTPRVVHTTKFFVFAILKRRKQKRLNYITLLNYRANSCTVLCLTREHLAPSCVLF